jgi:tripartite ATP-independent transporter DctM subunit
MVVFGILTNTSIGELLIAGIIPGIIFAILIIATVIIYATIYPAKAPRMTERYSMKEKLYSLRLIFPLVTVILVMIGGLYNGFFTPTEAGGIGALVTFFMALVRNRRTQLSSLFKTLLETAMLSAMIFAIIIGGLLFARFLALSGVSEEIKFFLTSTGLSTWVVVLLVTMLYLIFGMLMDAPSLLAISLPITHPVMMSLGFDPIWFGIYVVVLAEIGAITPPVGMNCFVVKGAANGLVTLEEIFNGIWPFLGACAFMLALLVAFPEVALYLPKQMN